MFILQTFTYTIFPLFAWHRINKNINYLCNLYERKYKAPENLAIFDSFLKQLTLCLRILGTNYSICAISFIISPVIDYILNGWTVLEPIVPYFWPGMSLDNTVHFGINFVQQAISMCYTGLIYIFYNLVFVFQVLHVILMTNMLKANIRIVSKLAHEPKPSFLKISMYLRTIINEHNDCLK